MGTSGWLMRQRGLWFKGAGVALAGALAAGVSGSAGGGESAMNGGLPTVWGDRHAEVTLASDHVAARPGQVVLLALTFEMKPGWHIYWRGLNDSGMPPEVKWELPAGIEVGETWWPGPMRYQPAEGILDYVHDGEATMLAELRVGEGAKVGSDVKIRARVDYLICADVCVPEDASVECALRIEEGARVTEDARVVARFGRAVERVPTALVPRAVAGAESEGDAAGEKKKERVVPEVRLEGKRMVVKSAGAKKVAFFVHETSAALTRPVETGERAGGVLELAFVTEGGREWPVGVVMVEGADAARGVEKVYYWVDFRPGAKAASAVSSPVVKPDR